MLVLFNLFNSLKNAIIDAGDYEKCIASIQNIYIELKETINGTVNAGVDDDELQMIDQCLLIASNSMKTTAV